MQPGLASMFEATLMAVGLVARDLAARGIVTYRWFFVSGPISTNEVSFERASKAELNVRMKSIRYLGAELQTFEN